jgi:HPt (histidine-containing phosphotransfer) domain-containing protein
MAGAFDEGELLERVGGDMEFLAETVGMLQTDGRALMDEIAAALAAGDAPTVGKVAHTLKGMVSNFCAAPAHAAALEMERAGKAGDLAAAASALEPLRARIEGLIAELDAFVKVRS